MLPYFHSIHDALTLDECRDLIARAEALGFGAAPITTAWGPRMAPEIRDNTRVMIDDPEAAAALHARLSDELRPRWAGWARAGLNERLRFYRYEVGQAFRWHRDGAFVREAGERSALTLLLYLNDDFEGGATELDLGTRVLPVRPRAGAALIFEHDVRHQGAPVTRGTKYVLRTDVMFARSVTGSRTAR